MLASLVARCIYSRVYSNFVSGMELLLNYDLWRERHIKNKNGPERVEDEKRHGRPAMSTDESAVKEVKKWVLNNCRLAIQALLKLLSSQMDRLIPF